MQRDRHHDGTLADIRQDLARRWQAASARCLSRARSRCDRRARRVARSFAAARCMDCALRAPRSCAGGRSLYFPLRTPPGDRCDPRVRIGGAAQLRMDHRFATGLRQFRNHAGLARRCGQRDGSAPGRNAAGGWRRVGIVRGAGLAAARTGIAARAGLGNALCRADRPVGAGLCAGRGGRARVARRVHSAAERSSRWP